MPTRLSPVASTWFVLALAVPTLAFAITLEAAPEQIERIEARYAKLERELTQLERELGQVVADGVPLRDRDDYIQRVLEIRRELARLDERRVQMTQGILDLPSGPPVLKLVRIEPNLGENAEIRGTMIRVDHLREIRVGANDTGFERGATIMRLIRAPLALRMGEPFSVEAEAAAWAEYPQDHRCRWPDPGEPRPGLTLGVSGPEASASARTKGDLQSYCTTGSVVKHEWPLTADRIWYTKSATRLSTRVRLNASFRPVRKTISGSRQLYFYEVTATGGHDQRIRNNIEHPFYTFSLPTDEAGYLPDDIDLRRNVGARGAEGLTIQVSAALQHLQLRYEPVRRGDRSVASLNIPEPPDDFGLPDREGSIRSVHAVPDLRGEPSKRARSELARMGLRGTALPGSPADDPGQAGTVERTEPAAGTTLARGATVKLFVHSGFATAVTIPDLRGTPIDDARRALAGAGFDNVQVRPGEPAASRDEENRVRDQDPPAGSEVALDYPVTLVIPQPFVDTRSVPRMVGMTLEDARSALQRAGLGLATRPGPAADNASQAGRVFKQDLPPEALVEVGTTVTLTTYGRYVPMVSVPNVYGFSYPDAKRRLESAGLLVDQRAYGHAPTRGLAGRVGRQSPAASTRVRPGKTVLIYVHGSYQPTPDEQVAAYDCSGVPNSYPGWSDRDNAPRCFCPSGYQLNDARSACLPAEFVGGQQCAQDYPNSVLARVLSDGSFECTCPGGLAWNSSRSACVAQRVVRPPPGPDCEGQYYWQLRTYAVGLAHPSTAQLARVMIEQVAGQARAAGCPEHEIQAASGGTGLGTGTGTGSGGFDRPPCTCVAPDGKRYRGAFDQGCPPHDSPAADYASCR